MKQQDPQVLELLRCPVTHSRLTYAPQEMIDDLNLQIESGDLTNQIGEKVEAAIDSGLLNEAGDLLLPVRGGIILLVTDQCIGIKKNNTET